MRKELEEVYKKLQEEVKEHDEKNVLYKENQEFMEKIKALNENYQKEIVAHNVLKIELKQVKQRLDEATKDFKLAESLRQHQDELQEIKFLEKDQIIQNIQREKHDMQREL